MPGKSAEARRRYLSASEVDFREPLQQLWALLEHYRRCAVQKIYAVGEVSCARSYTFAIPGTDFTEDIPVSVKYDVVEIIDELLAQVGRLDENVSCLLSSQYYQCVDTFVGLSQHVFNACVAYTDFALTVLLRHSSISSADHSGGREAARIKHESFIAQTFSKLPDLSALLRLE